MIEIAPNSCILRNLKPENRTMTTGYERIIGLNTPNFFSKDGFSPINTYDLSHAGATRRVIMLRAIPGLGRFPKVAQLEGMGVPTTARIMSMNGVPTVASITSFD